MLINPVRAVCDSSSYRLFDYIDLSVSGPANISLMDDFFRTEA